VYELCMDGVASDVLFLEYRLGLGTRNSCSRLARAVESSVRKIIILSYLRSGQPSNKTCFRTRDIL